MGEIKTLLRNTDAALQEMDSALTESVNDQFGGRQAPWARVHAIMESERDEARVLLHTLEDFKERLEADIPRLQATIASLDAALSNIPDPQKPLEISEVVEK